MSEATFWSTLVLSIVILMIPVVAWRFYFVDVHPTLSDRVRLKQRLSAIRYFITTPLDPPGVSLIRFGVVCLFFLGSRAHKSQDFLRTPSARRSRRSLRSGYAFAHQEGFGKLITSGKIMRKTGLNFGSKVNNSSNITTSGNNSNNNSASAAGSVPTAYDQADGKSRSALSPIPAERLIRHVLIPSACCSVCRSRIRNILQSSGRSGRKHQHQRKQRYQQ